MFTGAAVDQLNQQTLLRTLLCRTGGSSKPSSVPPPPPAPSRPWQSSAQGASDTLVGTLSLSAALPSVVSGVSRLVTLQVSREGSLDAYLVALRCTAQGKGLLMLSTRETVKLYNN